MNCQFAIKEVKYSFSAINRDAGIIFRRYPKNPILSSQDIPYPSCLVFNAGVTKWREKYVMMFRNDWGDFRTMSGSLGTNLGLATSIDGYNWAVSSKPCFELETGDIRRAYDPRLTVIDDRLFVCFAVDTYHGICGGVAATDDLQTFEILNISAPDNRNMVLFPERIGGHLARLERPFSIYGKEADESFDIWYAESPDGHFWGNNRLVLGSECVPFGNSKIGPSAPPIKTPEGWLTLIHVVFKDKDNPLAGWESKPWYKKYMVGLILLDIDKPWIIKAMCPYPIMKPEAEYPYEIYGFRGSVIFPSGLILEDDSQVKMYYGAADTVIALATTTLDELLSLVLNNPF